MNKLSFDWNSPEFIQLRNHLVEIRKEERKSKEPLYKFVDVGLASELTSNTNHVIFGRRGSGKSVLLRELSKRSELTGKYSILVDIGKIAEKSYPNLIIEILLAVFKNMLERTRSGFFSAFNLAKRNLAKDIETEIRNLDSLKRKSDEIKRKVGSGETSGTGRSLNPELAIIQNLLKLGASLSSSKSKSMDIEEEDTWKKIKVLFDNIENYRNLIERWLKELDGKDLHILLDDFYQVDQLHQPLIADYLKRLCYSIACYLKIATVRHRSLLFVKDETTEAGLQSGHDYTRYDLDFSLDQFNEAREFLLAIFHNICEGKIGFLKPESLFEDGTNGVDLLVEASGGNARDFINLLHAILVAKQRTKSTSPITYFDIRSAVMGYYSKEIREDIETTYINFELLNTLLQPIEDLCREHQDIGFCVANKDIELYPIISSVIGQLVDCKFIHLLTRSYSLADSKFASVYVLTMGIYAKYISDKRVNLLSRNADKKPYPQLAVNDLSQKFSNLAPDLALISKITRELD